jgi:hypothetical protein
LEISEAKPPQAKCKPLTAIEMKLKVVLLFLLLISISACQIHYDKKTYKKAYKSFRSTKGIDCSGYYSTADSAYTYWNYKRTEYGSIMPRDSMKIVYYNFIVLYDNGDAYVNLTTRYDGLHHYFYDDVAPTGSNTKESANAQFLKNEHRIGLFDNNRKWKYPGFYSIENDSITITYYHPIVEGNRQLTQLFGIVMNDSTFQINHVKQYGTNWPFNKTGVYEYQKKFEYNKIKKAASTE